MDEPEAVSRTLITNHYLCRKPDCFCCRLGEDAAASLSWFSDEERRLNAGGCVVGCG